jgi:hypothetical protein
MKTRIQKRSRKQEKRVAKELGGQVQPGSGSSWRAKSDVRALGKVRVECKYTGASFYALKAIDISKIQEEALLGGLEQWAMQIEFIMSAGHSHKVAVVSRAALLDLWFRVHKLKTINERTVTTPTKSYLLMRDDVAYAGFVKTAPILCINFLRPFSEPTVPEAAILNWNVFTDLLEGSASETSSPATHY